MTAPLPAAAAAHAGPDALDGDALYRAVAGRDRRFDGRVFLGVTSTGIYCRPSCPARTPRRENCRFFRTAAAARAAGFRACLRCRPEGAGRAGTGAAGDGAAAGGAPPGTGETGRLAARAVALVGEGLVDEAGVAGLAAALGVSERHLHRVLVREVGASPQALARTRRAQAARVLLEGTDLPLTDVAFTAGFASVRQFDDVLRAELGQPPSALRRDRVPTAAPDTRPQGQAPAAAGGPGLVLRLRHRGPLAADPLRRWLAAHAVPGLERTEPDGRHTRLLPGRGGPVAVTVTVGAAPDHVVARLRPAPLDDVGTAVAALRRWLDLDADPAQVATGLAADPLLAPLVAARPGLRVPGAVDGAETALLAVVGQHVSLAAARVFAGRLVAAYGEPGPAGLRLFPAPAALAEAGPEAVRATSGLTTARARTVCALAAALARGGPGDRLVLDPGADRDAARAALRALPGIGPWTTEYVALRALGDPDAYPSGDLVLRRALGVATAREAEARAAAWRPWRGYALLHLWTREVFA